MRELAECRLLQWSVVLNFTYFIYNYKQNTSQHKIRNTDFEDSDISL